MSIFDSFENGTLYFSTEKQIDLSSIAWSPHAKFEGVELKHLITSQDTGDAYSYHLVRVAPEKKIGRHVHETQVETHEVIDGSGVCVLAGVELDYQVGSIAVLPAGVEHEVTAGEIGLYLFAKFMPALC